MITINDCSEAKVKEIADKKAIKVDLEDELVETQARHAEVLRELEELAAYNVELHKSCDFVLKNFEVRQTARDQDEIKHKDFCTDELNTNVLQTEKKESEKADLIAKTKDLEMRIKDYVFLDLGMDLRKPCGKENLYENYDKK